MAPRTKYSKEEILVSALNITRQRGISAVTSRELGVALGTSARPIYTAFPNMEDLYQNIVIEAKKIYGEYVEKGLKHEYPFMGVGLQFVQFAMDEPQLFYLIFMTKQEEQIENIQAFVMCDGNYNIVLSAMKQSYQIDEEEAKWLYRNSFVYVYGIASLCVTGIAKFGNGEVYNMLNEMFRRWILGKELQEDKR